MPRVVGSCTLGMLVSARVAALGVAMEAQVDSKSLWVTQHAGLLEVLVGLNSAWTPVETLGGQVDSSELSLSPRGDWFAE